MNWIRDSHEHSAMCISGGRIRQGYVVALLALALTPSMMTAEDWYRWRGPKQNGISEERGWVTWPKEGPRQLWKASVGQGYSCMTIFQGRLYTMGVVNGQETVFCLDAATGKSLWRHAYPYVFEPKYYDGGSSATPTVDGQAVYTLGQAGELFCFDASSGQVRWTKNIQKELGAKLGDWGLASSPVIQGELLVLNVGTCGTALQKATGKVIWSTGMDPNGYSSAVPHLSHGRQAVAFFAARAVIGVETATGNELWRFPWKTDWDVNAADPIMRGDEVFISSSYGAGCALIEFGENPPRLLWKSKNMLNHFNSSVLIDGHLYGVSGEAGKAADLRCLEWKTGEVKWIQTGLGLGALMAASQKLIILSEKGELVVAEASPAGFKALARSQVLGGKCWTAPVLSNGRIYCRNSRGDLVCLDVRGK